MKPGAPPEAPSSGGTGANSAEWSHRPQGPSDPQKSTTPVCGTSRAPSAAGESSQVMSAVAWQSARMKA